MKFETNLILLIKQLCYMIKTSKQNLKYLENEKSLSGEIKSIFHHILRDFSCQKLSQTWECTFKQNIVLPKLRVYFYMTAKTLHPYGLFTKSFVFLPMGNVVLKEILLYTMNYWWKISAKFSSDDSFKFMITFSHLVSKSMTTLFLMMW